MGRVGSCFDNAASEACFSTLEHEVLSRYRFAAKAQARVVVTAWCHDFYYLRCRHSSAGLLPPVEYEKIAAIQPDAAERKSSRFGGSPELVDGALFRLLGVESGEVVGAGVVGGAAVDPSPG
jgi:hypothetical protein